MLTPIALFKHNVRAYIFTLSGVVVSQDNLLVIKP